MIEFGNIRKTYNEQTIVKHFNLTISAGEFVTIIGSSGSGKTTILKMINGLIKPDSGDILFEGKNIIHENLISLRRSIGYAVQGSVLFPHMTVEKNIAYVPNLINKQNKEKTEQDVLKWLKIVGLDENLLHRYPHELSGGQQQRVGIARALAASPKLLLMDEPFGAVDEITRHQLQEEISRIHKNWKLTIVFVTHDISEALKLGTRVLVMDKGIIHQYDKPKEILEKPKTDFVRQLVANHKN